MNDDFQQLFHKIHCPDMFLSCVQCAPLSKEYHVDSRTHAFNCITLRIAGLSQSSFLFKIGRINWINHFRLRVQKFLFLGLYHKPPCSGYDSTMMPPYALNMVPPRCHYPRFVGPNLLLTFLQLVWWLVAGWFTNREGEMKHEFTSTVRGWALKTFFFPGSLTALLRLECFVSISTTSSTSLGGEVCSQNFGMWIH